MYGVLLLPALQVLHVIVALYVGYSRISDHKHHATDVLAGFLVGVFTAIVSVSLKIYKH